MTLKINGKSIKIKRLINDLTITELAAQAKVSKDYVSKIENGHVSNVGFTKLVNIAKVLNVPLADLLTDDESLPNEIAR